MVGEQREPQENPLQQIPIAYWLLLAIFFTGLYIIVLMQIDASRARVLEFRFTAEARTMKLASGDSAFKKPSPFGKAVRTGRTDRDANKKLYRRNS